MVADQKLQEDVEKGLQLEDVGLEKRSATSWRSAVLCRLRSREAFYILAQVGLLVWVVIGFIQEVNNACDVPLKMWTVAEFVVIGVAILWVQAPIIRAISSCTQQLNSEELLPWLAKAYCGVVTAFTLVQLGIGLHLSHISEACEASSAKLFKAIRVYALFSIVCQVLVVANIIGISSIMSRWLWNCNLASDSALCLGTQQAIDESVAQPEVSTNTRHAVPKSRMLSKMAHGELLDDIFRSSEPHSMTPSDSPSAICDGFHGLLDRVDQSIRDDSMLDFVSSPEASLGSVQLPRKVHMAKLQRPANVPPLDFSCLERTEDGAFKKKKKNKKKKKENAQVNNSL